jgi:hypothetical protein
MLRTPFGAFISISLYTASMTLTAAQEFLHQSAIVSRPPLLSQATTACAAWGRAMSSPHANPKLLKPGITS